jgi:hypothetical protein
MHAWFDCGNGRQVYRRVREPVARSHLACPQIIKPFDEPVQSMADGKFYTSKADLARTYRPDGNPHGQEFIELGNETPTMTEYVPDPKERRDDIKQAFNDVLTGNIAPEIAAIE